MENQLAVLISFYEDEKNRLHKMLNNYLADADTDYLSAHFCSLAMSQINYKLQLLKNLEDPLYDEKSRQLKYINRYEKRLADEAFEAMKEYYEQDILKAKQELERLNQKPKPCVDEDDLSIMNDFLSKLLNNHLTKSELILNKKYNLLLRFSYAKKLLTIKIPYLKKHTTKYILYEDRIEALKNLGFQITNDQNNLVMFLTGERNKILNQLKSILSKIVFEIFHYSEFRNETYLRFAEKIHP